MPRKDEREGRRLPVHPCATMRVQIPLLARELAVQAVRACGLLAQTGDLVLLVGLEIALEPVPIGRMLVVASHARMCVAMRSRNQRSWEITTRSPGTR